MTRLLRAIVLAGALALGLAGPAARAQPADTTLRLSAGGVTGVYFALSSAICRLLEPDLRARLDRCEVLSSQGSVSNIRLVRAGVADLGLAQADMVRLAFEGAGAFAVDRANTSLRVLFATVRENLTIVTRPGSGITEFEDLLGRRVDFGPLGSGTRATALRFLEDAGYSLADFEPLAVGTSSLNARELCRGNADAFVFMAAHPNAVLQDAIAGCGASVLPGRAPVLEAFTQRFPEYRLSAIDERIYPQIAQDIPTIAVTAFVVADARLPEAEAYRLTRTVLENSPQLRRLHLAFRDIDTEELLQPCPGAPYHPGALRYFAEAGLAPPACP